MNDEVRPKSNSQAGKIWPMMAFRFGSARMLLPAGISDEMSIHDESGQRVKFFVSCFLKILVPTCRSKKPGRFRGEDLILLRKLEC